MALHQLLEHYWKPVADLIANDEIADICIDRFDKILVSQRGTYKNTGFAWASEEAFRAAVDLLIQQTNGARLDATSPRADARFDDGTRSTRITVQIPPLTPHTVAVIRIHRSRDFTLADLAGHMFPAEMRAWFDHLLDTHKSVLISGATDSGKTTLLRALLLSRINERMIVVEDTQELRLPLRNGVTNEVTRDNAAKHRMEHSIEGALRLAPQRIVVGELRTGEAMMAFIEAAESGFRGVCATVHASSALGTLTRIETKLARMGIFTTPSAYETLVRSTVDAVIHCAMTRDGERRVVEAVQLQEQAPVYLWRYDDASGEYEHDSNALHQVMSSPISRSS